MALKVAVTGMSQLIAGRMRMKHKEQHLSATTIRAIDPFAEGEGGGGLPALRSPDAPIARRLGALRETVRIAGSGGDKSGGYPMPKMLNFPFSTVSTPIVASFLHSYPPPPGGEGLQIGRVSKFFQR